MASIYYAGTYPPIMCGIATYTHYLTRESPRDQWSILSFDLEKYGAPLTNGRKAKIEPVWYGISGHHDYCAMDILEGLQELGADNDNAVLWFQHETAIWSNPRKFVAMLKRLQMPKVVTFHTLHFQSKETSSGLREYQYDLLQNLLPHVDAITVFSYGVYWAIISAFPEYCTKVYVLKHGIHSYPEISRLIRKEAKEKLRDFLFYESNLDQDTREALHQHRIFTDPDVTVIGQTGFLCPLKKTESLYIIREELQKMIPHKRIVAMRIGRAREESHKTYARKLHSKLNDSNAFLLDTWLPDEMMALAQRAFDINFYWPDECTQSGIMAHALGAGAIIAGRDLEGVGETLRGAGALVDTDLESLIYKIRKVILDPELGNEIESNALTYAREFSWKNQVRRHYALAESISHAVMPVREKFSEPRGVDSLIALVTGDPNVNLRVAYQRLLKNAQSRAHHDSQREARK
jgi:glycosyltransferase involved in cell wall biosynthesis